MSKKLTSSEKKKRLLKSRRCSEDVTQEKLAKKLGLSGAPAYCYIENNADEYFKLDILRALCKTLNIDIAEFIKED